MAALKRKLPGVLLSLLTFSSFLELAAAANKPRLSSLCTRNTQTLPGTVTLNHNLTLGITTNVGKDLELTINKLHNAEDSSAPNPAAYHRTGTVTHDGRAVYNYDISMTTDGYIITNVNWVGEVKGVKTLTLKTKKSDNTTTGSVDGRAIKLFKISPGFDPKLIQFQDSRPPVMLQPPSTITHSDVSGLVKGIQLNPRSASCFNVGNRQGEAHSLETPEDTIGEISLIKRTDRSVDLGHFSDTYGAGPCKTCKAGAYIAEGIALAACTASCIFSFGISCGFCYAAAGAGIISALEYCEHSSNCCPQLCSQGSNPILSPGLCCFGNERCLDQAGKCCGQDKEPCMGKSCCSFDQTCIRSGPSKGTCCSEGVSICGGTCCPGDGDTCVDNQCCSPKDKCGSACCRNGDGLLLFRSYCANASKSLCCLAGEVESTGICCPVGQKNCGGKCCAGACGLDGKCLMKEADCKARWGKDSNACQNTSQCQPGYGCHASGCCYMIPK